MPPILEASERRASTERLPCHYKRRRQNPACPTPAGAMQYRSSQNATARENRGRHARGKGAFCRGCCSRLVVAAVGS
eukprot:2065263-Amphidinium_carterae.1